MTGKAVLIPRDGGAIGPRVVAAAAAGAKAVLLYGDGPIANGALGLDDRVPIPVAVLPDCGRQACSRRRSTRAASATVTFGDVDRARERERRRGRGLLVDGPRLRRRAQARSRRAGRRDHQLARGWRLRCRHRHLRGRGAGRGRRRGAARDASRPGPSTSCAAPSSARRPRPGTTSATGVVLDPVEAQGAGAVDPVAASATSLVATPTSLSFGLAGSDPFSATLPVVLQNVTDQPVSVHARLRARRRRRHGHHGRRDSRSARADDSGELARSRCT